MDLDVFIDKDLYSFIGSAPPLATEVASLIKKVTPALRSHIRGFPAETAERMLACPGATYTEQAAVPAILRKPSPLNIGHASQVWARE